ncbi:hypothetical protein SERLADRAFT_459046 [Serpula lacrymans var. lacrymans S7.9]|nr:uncharacterized protein SERLADRAFT_459046 [Serpula lacrymans var. lacrymans S7.9]EGO28531.1 hypothetical protein SERLADRAFT_459046 [Serpula lacrymans var. lacrymans S7.9]
MEGDEEDDDEDMNEDVSDDENDEDDDIADDQSFVSVDDLEDEGDAHVLELSKLAEKDPEFYKYLQDNDMELLDFNPATPDDDDDDGDDGEEEEDDTMETDVVLPILTKDILRGWQKALLEHRSLRALRKLLLAFRSAAHMNEDDQVLVWSIDSAAVYSKLITTTLKYTPIILEHHIPYKTLANGKFKSPTQSTKQKTLQKLILSYFNNVIHLIPQVTDKEMLELTIAESAKILPYVITSRKAIKSYLKTCLEIWSTANDRIRITAFLAIRRLASSTDDSILDIVLKGTYLELVQSSKSTTAHKLPMINLMKNSASELFCIDHAMAYQHAFGYIRQLAILLRNSMKVKTKEAYKQVYNWQYAHCIDFWALVLARACDMEAAAERDGQASELEPLIYPLVQVSLGAIKLVPNARSYPFHLHIARSLLHLTRHSRTYIPLSPYVLPIITSTLASTGKPKSSTLRPFPFDTNIRVPSQYLKTRVYTEGVVEEATVLLAEWLATAHVQGSIAFPEIVVPVVVVLRKIIKGAKSNAKGSMVKQTEMIKSLAERVEESAKWVEQKRKGLNFSPGNMNEVESWKSCMKVEDTPLGKYLKVQLKAREKRRKLVDKAARGEDEILED